MYLGLIHINSLNGQYIMITSLSFQLYRAKVYELYQLYNIFAQSTLKNVFNLWFCSRKTVSF